MNQWHLDCTLIKWFDMLIRRAEPSLSISVYFSGEKFGYEPVTFGLYLDQVVRYVDKKGRTLSQYFSIFFRGEVWI